MAALSWIVKAKKRRKPSYGDVKRNARAVRAVHSVYIPEPARCVFVVNNLPSIHNQNHSQQSFSLENCT